MVIVFILLADGDRSPQRSEPYKRVINVEEIKQVEEVKQLEEVKRKKLDKLDIVLCMSALACTLVAVVMFVMLI
jgi:hypothetical protein